MPISTTTLRQDCLAQAKRLAFDSVGIASLPADTRTADRLKTFLIAGHHGSMTWMQTTADRRGDPLSLWPQAKTALMLGLSYAPDHDPMDALQHGNNGVISVYAHGRDYHDVLKKRLKQLAGWLATHTNADVKVFVDTAPLMEKPLAAKAGLGWQGKHTNLVSRTHGSWLFLGCILTTAEITPDEPEDDHCGSCQRCLDVCPTNAFPTPYQLDARRCIAYLTIEHQGPIPTAFRKPMGNRVFGCDDCLAVCPWNKFADASRETKFGANALNGTPPLSQLLALDDAAFRTMFAGTPVKRTGRDRVIRNALIAAANSGNPALLPSVTALLKDPEPTVRGAAVWATRELSSEATIAKLASIHAPSETDADVLREWQDALETQKAP